MLMKPVSFRRNYLLFSSKGTFYSPNLAVFLNSALMHFADHAGHDMVTILVETGSVLGKIDAARLILKANNKVF